MPDAFKLPRYKDFRPGSLRSWLRGEHGQQAFGTADVTTVRFEHYLTGPADELFAEPVSILVRLEYSGFLHR